MHLRASSEREREREREKERKKEKEEENGCPLELSTGKESGKRNFSKLYR